MTPPNFKRALFVDLLVCGATAVFFVGYHMPATGMRRIDELTYSTAAQQILASSDWLHPSFAGRPYLNKPPLKLWIVAASNKFFGQSLFAYRLPDIVFGTAAVMMVFLSGVLFLRSRRASYLAVSALLVCPSLLFVHGLREAAMEPALILATTGAMLLWHQITMRAGAGGPVLVPAIASGVLLGAGGLLKQAYSWLFLPLIAAAFVFDIERRRVDKRLLKPFALTCLAGVILPLLYFVPMSLLGKNVFQVMVVEQLYGRAVHGFHNSDAHFYYLRQLFGKHSPFPQVLLAAALLYLVWMVVRFRNRPAWILLVWGCGLGLLLSIPNSYLPWYYYPGYPAFALAIGAMLDRSICLLVSLVEGGLNAARGALAAALLVVLLYGAWTLGGRTAVAAAAVLRPPPVRPSERLVRDLREDPAFRNRKIAVLGPPPIFPYVDAFSLGMIGFRQYENEEDLRLGVGSGEPSAMLASGQELAVALRAGKPAGCCRLASFERKEPLGVVLFGIDVPDWCRRGADLETLQSCTRIEE